MTSEAWPLIEIFAVTDSLAEDSDGFRDGARGLRVVQVSGTIAVRSAGKTNSYAITEALLNEWIPANRERRFPGPIQI